MAPPWLCDCLQVYVQRKKGEGDVRKKRMGESLGLTLRPLVKTFNGKCRLKKKREASSRTNKNDQASTSLCWAPRELGTATRGSLLFMATYLKRFHSSISCFCKTLKSSLRSRFSGKAKHGLVETSSSLSEVLSICR